MRIRYPAPMTHLRVEDAAGHLRREYDALPGLHLSFWQARRLLNLPDALCDAALSQLLDTGYLVRSREGAFRRRVPLRTAGAAMMPVSGAA